MKYRYWFWGILAFVISLFFDKTILNFVVNNRIESLNNYLTSFTIITNGLFSLIIVGIILLVWKRKYVIKYILGFGVFGVLIWLLKQIVKRPRPFIENDIMSLISFKDGFSFPSGHASFAFFSLAFIWRLFPRFRWLWLIVVVLISVARVYAGVHYASDMIAGALLGIFFGSLVYKHKIKQKFFKK